MKYFRYAICLLLAFISLTVSGQNKTWLGATLGFAMDDFNFKSESPGFQELSLVSPTAGITIEQELNPHFSLFSGVLHKNQYGTITHADAHIGSGHHVMNLLRIPLAVKGRLQILSGNATLFALAGGNFMVNLSYSPGGEICTWCWVQQSPFTPGLFENVSEHYRTDLEKTYWLVEGGGGFEVRLLKAARLGFSVNHFFGFQNVVEATFDFTDPQGTIHHAAAYSKGNHWSATLHLHYPISRWWH